MSHKRVIKRRGKEYGPYIYESYRDKDGKVKKRYLGKAKEKKGSLVLICLIGLLVLVLVAGVIYTTNSSDLNFGEIVEQTGKSIGGFIKQIGEMSGLAVVDVEDVDSVSGDLVVQLKSGELIPAESKVVVRQEDFVREFNLSDFVEMNAEGNFYVEGYNIYGGGEGYGFVGERIVYPEISFVLMVKEKVVGGDDSYERKVKEEKEKKEKEEKEKKEKEEKEKAEKEKDEEEKDEKDEKEKDESEEAPVTGDVVGEEPVEKEKKDKEESSLITGGVVLGRGEVEGVVSYGNDFEYNLLEGETAKIKTGSISSDFSEEIEFAFLRVDVQDDKIVVSTDYNESEEGFGEDYLIDDEHVLSISLGDLSVLELEGMVSISLVYAGIEFASVNKRIVGGKIVGLNESVDVVTNVSLDFDVTTRQYKAVIGRPVKWIKAVKVENKSEEVKIKIPKQAKDIVIKAGAEVGEALEDVENYEMEIESVDRESLITGDVSLDIRGIGLLRRLWRWLTGGVITGEVILEGDFGGVIVETATEKIVDATSIAEQTNEEDVGVEYFTDAPIAVEEDITGGKRVVITGPDEVHYEDVLAYSELDNKISMNDSYKIKLYHVVEGEIVEQSVEEVNESVEEVIEEINESAVNESVEEVVDGGEVNESEVVNETSLITGQVIGDVEEVIVGEEVIDITNNMGGEEVQTISLVRQEIEFEHYDLDGDGMIDYIEWIVPSLSEQVYEIIYITKAEHLDVNRSFISDIYEEVREQDGVWSGVIGDGEYVRVTFERELDNTKDITIYARAGCNGFVMIDDIEVPCEIYEKKKRIDEIRGLMG